MKSACPFLALIFLAVTGACIAQPFTGPLQSENVSWRPPPPFPSGGWRMPGPQSGAFSGLPPGEMESSPQETTIDFGFVLLEGQDLAAPFEFDLKDGKIWINDHAICEAVKVELRDAGTDLSWSEEWRSVPLLRELFLNLSDGGLIIATSGAQPRMLSAASAIDVLTILSSESSRKTMLKKLDKLELEGSPAIQWGRLVDTFQPSDGFAERLDRAAESVDTETGRRKLSRRLLLGGGFLLATVGLGCLVLYRPATSGKLRTPELLSRTVLVCVVLLLAMNIYDLIATLQSCIPGGLREVNRLANPLLRTPLAISVAKLSAVGFGCFAIWRYRERVVASLAAWWLGLAYTVLTFHWAVCQYILLV